MLVAVQGRNNLAVIDPATATITRRVDLPGCDHDHGLAIDDTDRLAFAACDGNALLPTLHLNTRQIPETPPVGHGPDAPALAPANHRPHSPPDTRSAPHPPVHNPH